MVLNQLVSYAVDQKSAVILCDERGATFNLSVAVDRHDFVFAHSHAKHGNE
jgi:hypothetical protein